jgi:nicotinate-nucleotide adenylyltransferase
VADARELARSGGSFSHDTLVSLRSELGGLEPLCLLIGRDAFEGYLDWYVSITAFNEAGIESAHSNGVELISPPK